MQNIPIGELIGSLICLIIYLKAGPFLRSVGTKLSQQAKAGSCGMTWETKDGAVYHEIGPFFVRGNGVTFRHQFGTTRLLVADLTDASRAELIRKHHENFSLTVVPRETEDEQQVLETKAA